MKTNHQRGFKSRKDSDRYRGSPMGGTWMQKSDIADLPRGGASWGGDNSNGHRGHAKAKRGGKKFVNSRHRFHEKAATKKLATQIKENENDNNPYVFQV